MIFVDFSQIAVAAVSALQPEMKGKSPEACEHIIRSGILASILSNKKKFRHEYGQLVICCDSDSYWRRDRFPNYKAMRKVAREKSEVDWKFVFSVINKVREELEEFFPYKVLCVSKCEADDIIAVLSKWTQVNDLDTSGIEEISKRSLILSSDGDMKQLHQYSNIRQYSPIQKKYVERPKNIQHYIHEHIAKGDISDSVPGILGVDNTFVDKIRQPPLRQARLDEFLELGIGACRNDTEIRNWQRNEMLVSFEMIPEEISTSIISAFESCVPTGNQASIYSYLIKNRLGLFRDDLEDF